MKIVLYGAGIVAERYYNYLSAFGLEVDCFVDRNQDKWNTSYCDKKIRNPKDIIESKEEYVIVISVAFTTYEEVKQQLLVYGVPANRILTIETVIAQNYQSEILYTERKNIDQNSQPTYVFDTGIGAEFGGVETLVLQFVQEMKRRNILAKLIFPGRKDSIPRNMQEDTIFFKFPLPDINTDYVEVREKIETIARILEQYVPFTIYLTDIFYLYIATQLLKRKYGEQVRIISMAHGSDPFTITQHGEASGTVERILCVSQFIQDAIIKNYRLSNEFVLHKSSPVLYEKGYQKPKLKEQDKVVIGYAGRIVKPIKRADLLLPLMIELEKKKVKYEITVAGTGDYLPELQEDVRERKLEHRIKFMGRIPHEQMSEFWKKCHIYLALSEFEGMSISMLEAMSYGNVPVVTRVNGINEFIKDAENGFTCQFGNLEVISSRIHELQQDKIQLEKMSLQARQTIESKCSLKEYVDYLLRA